MGGNGEPIKAEPNPKSELGLKPSQAKLSPEPSSEMSQFGVNPRVKPNGVPNPKLRTISASSQAPNPEESQFERGEPIRASQFEPS